MHILKAKKQSQKSTQTVQIKLQFFDKKNDFTFSLFHFIFSLSEKVVNFLRRIKKASKGEEQVGYLIEEIYTASSNLSYLLLCAIGFCICLDT